MNDMTSGQKHGPERTGTGTGELPGPLGYYPGFSTLDQRNFWDAKTREVVLERVSDVPPIRFFTADEAELLRLVCEHMIPQADRGLEDRIPIAPQIDRRLYEKGHGPTRFADMPSDRDAYRVGLKAIDQVARELHGRSFAELAISDREAIMKSLHDGTPAAAHDIWQRLPVKRFWEMLAGDCATAYYAHPFAWDEIGFGGPAYPRSYIRLDNGTREPWEVDETRYNWQAPEGALSDLPETAPTLPAPTPRKARPRHRTSLKSPLLGAFGRSDPDTHMLGSMQRLTGPMNHFGDADEVDYVVVGVGSAGGVLLQRLARAGLRVVGIEAGPFWDSEKDWVSDEAGSGKLYWDDLRISGGENPLVFGANNSGRGVGGGSIHWSAATPRLHPSDFRTFTLDGVGADWPISYEDLKPYYELMELELPVSGPAYFPWGDPHGYAYGPHPAGEVTNVLSRGCTKLGLRVSVGGPVAILQGSRGDRPHCIYRGFCNQGCKVGAKASTLITHIPDAIASGAEVRANCMVSRVHLGENKRVTGVSYFDSDGREHFQKAKAVILSAYAIETPRLLFNSACPGFENGLANSSDTLGRYLMVQASNIFLGYFDELVRMYKAPPAGGINEDFYETDWSRGFARGFGIHTLGPLPIGFAKLMIGAKGAWGWGLRRVMMNYNHYAALGLIGEILPHAGNRVEVAEETDQYGLRVPKITFALRENDKKMIEFGKQKITEVMLAAGAREVVQTPRYSHLVGGARMGTDPAHSVVDRFGRSHDIANLFICDGSVFPTQGSANPGLTIMALAARTADYLISQGARVFNSDERDPTAPSIRRDLAPPDTWGHGAPRLK